LGVRAYETQGRPTLDCRWDTLMFKERLRSELVGDWVGSPRLAIREESRRLIEVAKDVGDFISYDTLKSLGLRVKKSGAARM